ncbi:NAD-dependent epimerase/dehydratase family protein [Leucobacter albus]|uniref:NAD-dependent epimerase/dehydratase family protein n=1 Tax=Leucobacter albus TaxID=272210 RepID=A0ABW3TLZ8_9MICO
MPTHLVLGAGLIGAALTRELAARGDRVTVASRRGTPLPGATPVALHAGSPADVSRAARGTDTIFLCTNPPYPAWATEWPPVFEAAIAAARNSGASLVVMGNLYAHGRVTHPMTAADAPRPAEHKGEIRARGWADVLAAHSRGEIRAVEVRASDYFGPGAGPTAHLGHRFFDPLLAGKTAWAVGDPAQPHAWSYLPDIARTLVAAASAPSGLWGRPWLVPSHARSQRDIAAEVEAITGVAGRVRGIPTPLLRALGAFDAQLREVARCAYQFEAPFLVDTADTEAALGVTATPWGTALAETVAAYQRG